MAAIASVAVLLLLVTGWIMDRRLYSQNYHRFQHDVNIMRDAIETVMLDEYEQKQDRVHTLLDRFLQDSTYLNIWLISTDTTVLFSGSPEIRETKLDLLTAPGCRSCHNNPDMMRKDSREYFYSLNTRALHYITLIRNKKECTRCHDPNEKIRATLVTDFSLSHLDGEIWMARLQLHSFLTVSFVLIVVFAYFLLKAWAFKPLELIATRLRLIGEGKFAVHEGDERENIIGFIGAQLNQAAQRLGSFYSELEAKVDARTRSLQTSERLLAEERDKLAFILESSPQGFVGIAGDGVILFANRKAGECLSVSSDGLSNEHVSQSGILQAIFDGHRAKNAAGEPAESFSRDREHYKNSSGRELEVQTSLTAMGDRGALLLVVLTDVTERRRIERNLERHERLASVGQLAAGVAHEVGNPLSAISSLIQIARKANDPLQSSDSLDLITYHIERISKIVRNLSSFARVPDEKAVFGNVFDIVRGAVEIARFDPRAKNVDMNLLRPEQRLILEVRRDQFLQAVLNIVLNSLDAVKGRPDPRITVKVEAEQSWCTVSVADNGIGIEEAGIDRIFEPFYTTKPVGRGTGLGLSVTYRIITDMGGQVSVESTPGVGTTFTIKLPSERTRGRQTGESTDSRG